MQYKKMGIYILKNLQTNTVVVGQSIDCARRKSNYYNKLRKNCYPNKHLQASWNKHGEEAFEFIILEEVKDVKFLTSYEQSYLDYYRTLPAGVYNQIGPADSPLLGFNHTQESRNKISENNGKWLLGKSHSSETKEKLSFAALGRKITRSEEYRKALSLRQKGKPLSPERKELLAKARLKIKHKPLSEETKAKIALSLKSHPVSDATREKMKQSRLRFIEQSRGKSEV